MCLTVSPTTFTSSTRFALSLGQTEPLIADGAGTVFSATNAGADIGLRMTAFDGLPNPPLSDSSTGTLSIDFSGTYDANPVLNRNYHLLMIVATTSFTSGSDFSTDVKIDGSKIGQTFNGTWDGSENYISFSALNGGFAADDLKIIAGIATNCS